MAQVLKFQDALDDRGSSVRNQVAPRNRQDEDEEFSFWPEVSSGLWVRQPEPANPANSSQRVISEMLLVLGGAALLVMLTTIFLGASAP